MTSIRRKPTVLGSRRNTVEQEREQFQRSQEASFRKAINEEEVPVKMKHVRNLIIGTHTDRNGSVVWGLVSLSPPIHTDVTAWKFCHTLHLILRDGHPNALKDSVLNISIIKNMGEHFRHLPAGYGGLIQRYCALLICKLNFHQHYPRFPGTLQVTPDELESIAENDANNYFEMAVEMLEYMEKILKLYEGVFDSLDLSRANSMTKLGQCRLSPLIPCIQDSSSLYDFIVRILFKLHKIVPTDMLSGHRTRFQQQFKFLNTFYNSTRNLQYFKTLIQVPHLPQVPPNFLIEAELRSHVAPVVVLEEEQPDPSETQESVLIDTSEPSPPPVPPHPHPDVVNSHNGPMMEVMAERDAVIDALQEELRESRNAIQTLRSENPYIQEQLRLKINELESTIAELDSELTAEKQSKESILAQVEAAAVSAEAVTRLSDEETRRRTAEEKFAKMKEVYQKLRDEHISLIRMKAEMEKNLSDERRTLREEQDKRKEREMAVKRLEAQLVEQNQTQQSIDEAYRVKDSVEKNLSVITRERDEVMFAKDALQMTLNEVKENMAQQVEELQQEREAFLNDISSLETIRDEKELDIVALKESLIELKERLEAQLQDISAECTALTKYLKIAQAESIQLNEGKIAIETDLLEAQYQIETNKNLHTSETEKLKEMVRLVSEKNLELIKEKEELRLSSENRQKSLQRELDDNVKELNRLSKKLEDTVQKESEVFNTCGRLEAAKSDLEGKIEEIERRSALKEKELQEELSGMLVQKGSLENEVVVLKDAFTTLQHEKELQCEKNKLKIKELWEKLEGLQQSKDQLEREKRALRDSFYNLEKVIEIAEEKARKEQLDVQKVLKEVKGEKARLLEICDSQEVLITDLRKSMENISERSSKKQSNLMGVINNLEKRAKQKDEEIKELNENLASVKSVLADTRKENEDKLSNAQTLMESNLESCVASAVDSNITSIAFSLSHFDSEAHRLIKSTPEYTLLYKSPIENAFHALSSAYTLYVHDVREAPQIVKGIDQFGNYVSSFLLYGKASSHVSPHIDTAENLVTALEELAKQATELLEGIRSKTFKDEDAKVFPTLLLRCCDLVCACEDLSPSQEDMASIVQREMEAMNSAIHEAVEKFSRMLEESRAKDTGMQLEVNEGILATCGELMSAVRLLVQRASELQTEIVAAGKKGASPREFYKRNHRWTEGLISGAKTVAIACQALVDAADEVVSGRGKFEEVIVASKEIAASSMQLVMASRVKADKESQRLGNLNMAAKTISMLTGTVVATAESCRDKVTEATTLDFSKLTLHSAKRLEMETLVKVLETEKKLETERTKLGELRRHHYQLAGELEGWEEEDMRK